MDKKDCLDFVSLLLNKCQCLQGKIQFALCDCNAYHFKKQLVGDER